MRILHLRTFFLATFPLLAAACGSKVVVESTGASGAGTGGTSSNGDGGYIASTGDVSPVGVVSASSGGTSLCEQVCAKQVWPVCGEGCVADCQDAYAAAGACAPQLDAVAQCFLTGEPGCGPTVTPLDCTNQLDDYTSCMSPVMCGTTSCSVSNDGSCDCQTHCSGSKVEVQCTAENATAFCTCFKDGMPISKCSQSQGSELSCDIVMGCCAAALFP